MELSYFRKSTRSFDDTIKETRAAIEKAGITVLAEKDLTPGEAYTFVACKPEWARKLIAHDHRLAGFMPCAFHVLKKDGDVLIGTGQPSIIKSLVQQGPLVALALEADAVSKDVVHDAAGVGPLTPSGVLVYATMQCPYCTKVKEWLEANKIEHTVKYVDLDREAGRAMVEKTGQMGVPVTEISYDDAQPVYVVGFDEPQLADLLNVK